jgi:hypothetical protein
LKKDIAPFALPAGKCPARRGFPYGQGMIRAMRRFAGSCRVVLNEALALRKERRDSGKKKPGYAETGKHGLKNR